MKYITFPWSNERRNARTASEHLYSPIRLPLSRIDVFNTLMAPLVNPTWSLVMHLKTMHAFTTPESIGLGARLYRQMNYPRSVRLADAIIINSESLRSEVLRYLDVDPAKLRLINEAVDHDLFKPGDADLARSQVASYGVTKPFVLFVSSLWSYKNCDGLLRAWAHRPERASRAATRDRGRRARREVRWPSCTRSSPSSASGTTWCSSAGFPSRRPSTSTGRPTYSSTRR